MSPPSLLDYARRAFFFRPWGMPLPPNLFFLAGFGMVALREPAVLLVAAGFELVYLLSFVTHPRFRALVEREHAGPSKADTALDATVAKLSAGARRRFEALRERCEDLLGSPVSEALGQHHAEALGGLLQVYLQLLVAREGVARLVTEVDAGVEGRLRQAEARLADPGLDAELRSSLTGQVEVLRQRVEGQQAASRKLQYVDGELGRVEDQVELLREQALLDTGAAAVGTKIDAIAGALSATRRWLADERALVGDEDTTPAVVLRGRAARAAAHERT